MADILDFPVPDPSRFSTCRADAISRALLHPHIDRLQQELNRQRQALDELDLLIGSDPPLAALRIESAKVRELISTAESKLGAIL
ncbi:hypothetical protein LQG66_03375 [Bradyrhizobium ontarionense]|uniref:DUF465 domain-containing protein n=1 Tax=Bradyrhizobium ontarionense TaxID=2898149 RepID=A0ABY3RDM4_9BRAD|nr:hypothetical protein [Bradyrhizobium sp. A19]UFZ05376.1 hypothetical protein LQG66_03375 [Bradyrhizobium sp. A19]